MLFWVEINICGEIRSTVTFVFAFIGTVLHISPMLTPRILVAFILLDFKVLNFITPMQGQYIEEKSFFYITHQESLPF